MEKSKQFDSLTHATMVVCYPGVGARVRVSVLHGIDWQLFVPTKVENCTSHGMKPKVKRMEMKEVG